MQINFDHEDTLVPERMRALALLCAYFAGDLDDPKESTDASAHTGAPSAVASVADTTMRTVPKPPMGTEPAFNPKASAAMPNATASAATNSVPPPPTVHTATSLPSIPPPPVPAETTATESDGDLLASLRASSNVVNFPVPPPPPPSVSIAAPIPPAPAASPVADAGTVVSVELDTAGMPWDARIHQKSRNKTKPGTWKVIKGLDPAVLQAVVMEIAAARTGGASAPVSLPATAATAVHGGSVPVPPPPPPAPASSVPPPPPPAPVPGPPAAGSAPGGASAGGVAASPYSILVDKIIAANKAKKITPQQITQICQATGAPSLMELNKMPELIDAVSGAIDLAILSAG